MIIEFYKDDIIEKFILGTFILKKNHSNVQTVVKVSVNQEL